MAYRRFKSEIDTSDSISIVNPVNGTVAQLRGNTGLTERLDVTLQKDLYDALDCLALAKGMTMSKTIEKYLLENPVVRGYLNAVRKEPKRGCLAVSEETAKG